MTVSRALGFIVSSTFSRRQLIAEPTLRRPVSLIGSLIVYAYKGPLHLIYFNSMLISCFFVNGKYS